MSDGHFKTKKRGTGDTKRRRVIILLLVAAVYCLIGCPFRFFFGICCPGCGMTRAILALLRLDFSNAWDAHPLVFALPFWGVAFWWQRHSQKGLLVVTITLCVCLTAVYIWRLVRGVSPEIVFIRLEEGFFYKLIHH